jgi:hypothetical protein
MVTYSVLKSIGSNRDMYFFNKLQSTGIYNSASIVYDWLNISFNWLPFYFKLDLNITPFFFFKKKKEKYFYNAIRTWPTKDSIEVHL